MERLHENDNNVLTEATAWKWGKQFKTPWTCKISKWRWRMTVQITV